MTPPDDFGSFIMQQFRTTDIHVISDSNNPVYQVRSTEDVLVVKRVVDTDIPNDYVTRSLELLGRKIPTQQVVRQFRRADGDAFDAVVSRLVPGITVADALSAGDAGLDDEHLCRYFLDFVAACKSLPPLVTEFGLFKTHTQSFSSLGEFLIFDAGRYWSRVRPVCPDANVVAFIDSWLASGLQDVAKALDSQPLIVPIDANLKNFVVRPDGTIVLLNVPILGNSCFSHGLASISAHLRNRPAHDMFLDLARARSMPTLQLAAVPHFELWLLLGILAFYVKRGTGHFDEWRDWGAPNPLMDDFCALAREVDCEAPH